MFSPVQVHSFHRGAILPTTSSTPLQDVNFCLTTYGNYIKVFPAQHFKGMALNFFRLQSYSTVSISHISPFKALCYTSAKRLVPDLNTCQLMFDISFMLLPWMMDSKMMIPWCQFVQTMDKHISNFSSKCNSNNFN